MDITELDNDYSQKAHSTMDTPDSHAFVQDEAEQVSSSANQHSMATFNKRTKRWELGGEVSIDYEACYAASRLEYDILLETINKYTEKAKKPPLALNAPDDWIGVEHSAQAACEAMSSLIVEDQAITGLRRKLQEGFQKLCQHAGAGQTFVSLIPSDLFGLSSLLCGALKMIFSAMQQSETHRTEVYKALAELPNLIYDHSAVVKGLENDEKLHYRASELYASIFRLLGHIFKWFSYNPFMTAMKFILNPNRLGERLKESTAEVNLKAKDFCKRAMILSLQLQDKSIQLQCWSHFNQINMGRNVEHLLASTSSIYQMLYRMETLQLLDPVSQSITEEIATRQHEIDDTCKVASRLQTNPKRRKMPKRHARTYLINFFEDFHYDQRLVFQDCHSLTSLWWLPSVEETVETYLTAMQCSFRMRVFLTADEPSLLAVMGHCDPQPDSEISLLTAKIVDRLFFVIHARHVGEKLAIIPLAFFCGRHRRDRYTNPTEVALSLLMQLIDRYRDYIDLEFLDRCRASMEPTDIQSVCCALRELIESLSDNVILVVIIDGLEFSAQATGMRESARHLFQTLVSIYRSRLKAMMKCLFMSSSRLGLVGNVLGDDEILEISMDSHHYGQYPEWLGHEPLQLEFD